MGINILSEEVFNKISAGEVVERPASIVKELVENAIDAGASKIGIEVFDGGIKQIIITDNGSGIEPEDVDKAFMPHATSKIKVSEDLENIASLGFRGEALASIASVSQIEMTTKTENNDFGVKICLSAGKKQEKVEVGATTGTKIIVKNLFFNTPARLKFLKKPKTEEGEITHLVGKMILANPTISFRYSVEGKIIYNTFGNGLAEALYIVYGKEVYDNLVEVNRESGNIAIRGYIARPTLSKPNRSYGTLFVNGRLVNNYMIFSAITDALDGYLMKGKFPLFALNLTLPFEDVDVNVHPSKQEVKFANPGKIYGFVSNAIFESMQNVSFVQQIEEKEEIKLEEKELPTLSKNEGASFKFVMDAVKAADDKISCMQNKLVEIVLEDDVPKTNKSSISFDYENFIPEEKVQTKIEEVFNNFKIVGTVFDTYIIIEKEDKVYFIDQHAAHERQLYDKIMASVESNKVMSQSLFVPIEISLNEKEINFLNENYENFKKFGFNYVIFDKSLKIISIPYLLEGMNIKEFFNNVLSNMETYVNKPLTYINEKFTQLACKSAIKAGNKISDDEINILINKFLEENNTLLCPHGRPIILEISKFEIEKMFRRKL